MIKSVAAQTVIDRGKLVPIRNGNVQL